MGRTTQPPKRKLKALIWVAHHLEVAEIIERYVQMAARELESHGHEVVVCRDIECAIREVEDADIMLCWRIVPEVLANATRLRWIQFGSAGIDHTLFPELLGSEVTLTNVSGIHRTPVSEHVLALMLALSRRLHLAIRLQIERRYDRSTIAPAADELSGKTIGIVGIGKIGLELARICKCLGMTVVGTKRTPLQNPAYLDEVLPPSALDQVLERSDFLVLVLPLTAGTELLLGERELALMKPSAFIINVARGQMIDEAALARALRAGRLAGAALDVFSQEPLPPESPLYDLPNVIITPHVAGAHRQYPDRAFEVFKTNLAAFEAGRPMINVFDRERGY
jgi:phosphoglycerate dehydrogenase-like enzyme